MTNVQAMREATDELAETLETLSKSSAAPILSAWRRFTAAAHADGAVSRKHKELIAVAVSIVKGCERCISYHVKAALAHGATAEEIVEAAFVAVIMDGGSALAHMGLVLDAMEAHKGDVK
jgi:AhpD family alkylhydroperoxidase